MNCPFCGKEMERGFLQTGNKIIWAKKQHSVSLVAKEGEVALGNAIFGGIALDAFICKDCKKVVVDYFHSNYEEK